MSNQFVEIKATVFKKFEKENLFQMSCADIIERFHLSLLLTLILLRNLVEHTASLAGEGRGWAVWVDLWMPFFMVLGSELVVDWCKHAFVTKFNHIRPSVYGRFVDILCLDFVKDGKEVSSLPVCFLCFFCVFVHGRNIDGRRTWIKVLLLAGEWVFLQFH